MASPGYGGSVGRARVADDCIIADGARLPAPRRRSPGLRRMYPAVHAGVGVGCSQDGLRQRCHCMCACVRVCMALWEGGCQNEVFWDLGVPGASSFGLGLRMCIGCDVVSRRAVVVACGGTGVLGAVLTTY